MGGYAVTFHGYPRYTKDVDVFVDSHPTNAERVLQALREFGAPVDGLTATDLGDPDNVFQVGVAPNRVDVLGAVTGITFDEAWAGRVASRYGDVEIHYVGLEALLRAKRASGRPRDLLDVEELERRTDPGT